MDYKNKLTRVIVGKYDRIRFHHIKYWRPFELGYYNVYEKYHLYFDGSIEFYKDGNFKGRKCITKMK